MAAGGQGCLDESILIAMEPDVLHGDRPSTTLWGPWSITKLLAR